MRAEKLEELNDYIRELQTVKKTLVASEYIFDDKNVKGSKKYLFHLKNNLLTLLQKNTSIKRKGFMDVEKYMVELANGMVVPREKIIKGGGDKSAAIVMPVTKDNNTILVVQSRSSTKESVCVEFPAGYIEEGESPEYGAKREVMEETGYLPQEMIFLDKFYQDQSCGVCAQNYSYLALGCEKVQGQNLDDNEAIRYFECSVDEVLELMERGYITDIQTKYTLNLAKPYVYQKTANAKLQK